MTNLDRILKRKMITLLTKIHSQSYGFSSTHVQTWVLDHKEGWVLKNWCFQIVVLKKTLEGPLDSKETKPVNPKRNQPWIFIEGLMLKLKLQYFGHLMRRADSLEMTETLEKTENKRRRGRQRIRWLDSITDSMDMNQSKLRGTNQFCVPEVTSVFFSSCDSVVGDFGRWLAHEGGALINGIVVQMLGHVWLFATSWIIAH